jgi:hypothetical protein
VVGNLSADPVEPECGEKAKNAVRHSGGHLNEQAMLGGGKPSQPVGPSRHAHQDPFLAETLEIRSCKAKAVDIT